jgi:hypothetical protein
MSSQPESVGDARVCILASDAERVLLDGYHFGLLAVRTPGFTPCPHRELLSRRVIVDDDQKVDIAIRTSPPRPMEPNKITRRG